MYDPTPPTQYYFHSGTDSYLLLEGVHIAMTESPREQTAHSWQAAKRLARRHRYGTKITVPMHSAPYLPPGFEQSALSINNGAKAVYRDQRARDSFQIREFDDHWTIEMDKYNPEQGYAIQHAVADAPGYTLAATAVLGAFFAAGGS